MRADVTVKNIEAKRALYSGALGALRLGGLSYALIGAAVLTVGQPVPAAAQETARPAAGGFARSCADIDARLASRLAYFSAKLALTSGEQGDWSRFQSDMKGATEPVKQVCAKVLNGRAPTRLPDRMAVLVAISDARGEALRRESRAVAQFYRALSPQQQTVADHLKGFGGER